MDDFFYFFLEIHNPYIFWDALCGVQRAPTLEYERSEAKLAKALGIHMLVPVKSKINAFYTDCLSTSNEFFFHPVAFENLYHSFPKMKS